MPDPFSLSGILSILVGGSVLLGILVFIHEAGHYLVAKLLGIKVEVFSLGFGPRIAGFESGGTDYRVSAIPLGGYVKMLGENPDESLSGSREEFLSRPKFQRFLVLVMGASLNIVLAVAIMAGIYIHGMPEALYLNQPPVVGVLQPDGAAAEAGLRIRDEILAVDGRESPTWSDMEIQIALNPEKEVNLRIRRAGEVLDVPVKVRARERDRTGVIGVGPLTPIAVAEVEEGGPADRAGLRAGDMLLAVEERELVSAAEYESLHQTISSNPGRPVALLVSRDGRQLDLTIVPDDRKGTGDPGMSLSFPTTIRKYGIVEAVRESVRWNLRQSTIIFLSFRKLLTRELSPRSLSGPIEIFRMTGKFLQGGWIPYLVWMAAVSMNLGVVNLLPIPILDGGHIFILLVEGLIRRDLSMRIKERVMQFGLILLLLIMGSVIFLDIDKNLPALREFFRSLG